ncbi:26S proteasome non-ATPase regulatory subunit 6 [Aphelenchoides besseyi]|nr:26S proteasome non-ATPase regulatory subunit 6 [Aphelenchoides besseyi]KAI6202306.1 26S proteasome non-ATPase regulatory subunit 6 [Aphelenchoides besseyi]
MASSEAKSAKSAKPTLELDKDVISKVPDLEIAQLRFLINHIEFDKDLKEAKWQTLLEKVKEYEMAPFYELVCTETNRKPDESMLKDLKAKNTKRLQEIEAEIVDAEQNLGESEVRQAWLRKSEYLCQIGDKTAALTAFRTTYEKTVGIGYRIDLVFSLIRFGLFFLDHKLINSNIAKAKDLMEQGGDWERKNRLRSYEALYKMAIRDMKGAASLFLETVPTFGSYELMSYDQLIFYTIVTSVLALDRPDLRVKVMRSNEIQERLNGGGEKGELIPIKHYLDSFYNCHYDQFFVQLASLESQRLKFDRYLAPHYGFYSRAMRLKAYTQFLTPYKTVRLDMMAKDFGVSKSFIDRELHRLVASGSLSCRIDAVNGTIEMSHHDNKDSLYKTLIRDGDILLNRIQKLARVINA